MFSIKREIKTRYLRAYFVVYAGTLEIASFPSPEIEFKKDGTSVRAHDFYGKEPPTFHPSLRWGLCTKIIGFMQNYFIALRAKKPLPTVFPLEVYDAFYVRNNG